MEKKNENNLMKIYKYGDDILRLKAQDVRNIDEKFVDLVHRMTETLYKTRNAVGLAAPQVGESLRLSVIDLSQGTEEGNLIVLINPEIIEADGKDSLEEGCLSFPGISATINRSTKILLQTVTMQGKEVRQEIDGFLARVVQHEIDHLNGITIIDRVSSLKRQLLKREIKTLQEEGEW